MTLGNNKREHCALKDFGNKDKNAGSIIYLYDKVIKQVCTISLYRKKCFDNY